MGGPEALVDGEEAVGEEGDFDADVTDTVVSFAANIPTAVAATERDSETRQSQKFRKLNDT